MGFDSYFGHDRKGRCPGERDSYRRKSPRGEKENGNRKEGRDTRNSYSNVREERYHDHASSHKRPYPEEPSCGSKRRENYEDSRERRSCDAKRSDPDHRLQRSSLGQRRGSEQDMSRPGGHRRSEESNESSSRHRQRHHDTSSDGSPHRTRYTGDEDRREAFFEESSSRRHVDVSTRRAQEASRSRLDYRQESPRHQRSDRAASHSSRSHGRRQASSRSRSRERTRERGRMDRDGRLLDASRPWSSHHASSAAAKPSRPDSLMYFADHGPAKTESVCPAVPLSNSAILAPTAITATAAAPLHSAGYSQPTPPPLAPTPLAVLHIRDISTYEKLNQIGEGTYGKVYKGKCKQTGQLVALKKVRMETEKEGFPITATREIKILTSLNHSNVVRLIEMVTSKASVYLVFEYMDHDMAGLITHPQVHFSISHVKCLLRQLLVALAYLHDRHIFHRDIKGSNLLLSRDGVLKLADFGLARAFRRNTKVLHATNRVITLWYRPPELLLGSSDYGPEVDIWGVGCLFMEWLTKTAPFQGVNEMTQLDAIYRVCGTPDLSGHMDAYPVLSKCPWSRWIKPKESYPNTLPSTAQRACPELSPVGLNLLQALLTVEPSARISAKEALRHPFFTEDPHPSPLAKLPVIEGDWHEYETKLQKKKKAQSTQELSSSTGKTPSAHHTRPTGAP